MACAHEPVFCHWICRGADNPLDQYLHLHDSNNVPENKQTNKTITGLDGDQWGGRVQVALNQADVLWPRDKQHVLLLLLRFGSSCP
jgi:hypothetical protein